MLIKTITTNPLNMLKVPLIQSGLTQTETIVQIANVFEYLDGIVNHVFDKITTRIEASNNRVHSIQERIETASQQVDALKSTKKSILIFSPGRYPGRNDCGGIPATFSEQDDKAPTLDREFPLTCQATPLGDSCIKDKLQFFHVRSKDPHKDHVKLDNASLCLGATIPQYVTSVPDLYLHNSTDFAYQQRQRVRNKLEVPGEKKELERSPSKLETSKKLDEATMPHSILHPDWAGRQSADNFFYTPTINDAPDLELPEDLPDLPGIAIDIAFGKSSGVSDKVSAPSVPKTVIAETKEEVDNGPERSMEAPPQPPVLPALPSFTATAQETIKPAGPSVGPPPPPPPPPPPLPSFSMTPETVQPPQPPMNAVKKEQSASSSNTDARSNLMDAIRKAGGKAKLRAAEPQPERKQQSEKSSSSGASGGNLMDDLHKKLMMRRKGISGTKKAPTNVMDRLSAMIPPPEVVDKKEAEEEEDWN